MKKFIARLLVFCQLHFAMMQSINASLIDYYKDDISPEAAAISLRIEKQENGTFYLNLNQIVPEQVDLQGDSHNSLNLSYIESPLDKITLLDVSEIDSAYDSDETSSNNEDILTATSRFSTPINTPISPNPKPLTTESYPYHQKEEVSSNSTNSTPVNFDEQSLNLEAEENNNAQGFNSQADDLEDNDDLDEDELEVLEQSLIEDILQQERMAQVHNMLNVYELNDIRRDLNKITFELYGLEFLLLNNGELIIANKILVQNLLI